MPKFYKTVIILIAHNPYRIVNFVNKLAKHFSIYFATVRTNTINNRNATMKSLHNFTYDKLLMRPHEIKTAIYKYNIKKISTPRYQSETN